MIDTKMVTEFAQDLHAHWIQEYPQLKEEFLKMQESYLRAKQNLENHKSTLLDLEMYNTMENHIDDIYEKEFKLLEIKLRTNLSYQLYDPLSGKIQIPKGVKKLLRQKRVSSYDKVIALFSIDISNISVEIYSRYLTVKYAEYEKRKKESLADKKKA